jgi:hypothetical protein
MRSVEISQRGSMFEEINKAINGFVDEFNKRQFESSCGPTIGPSNWQHGDFGEVLSRHTAKYGGTMVPLGEAKQLLRAMPSEELAASGLTDDDIRTAVFNLSAWHEHLAIRCPEGVMTGPERGLEGFVTRQLRESIEYRARLAAVEGSSQVIGQSEETSVAHTNSLTNPLEVACFDRQTGRPEFRRQAPFGSFICTTADVGLNHSEFAGPGSDAVNAFRPLSDAVASKRKVSREDVQTLILTAAKNPDVYEMHVGNLKRAEFVTNELSDKVLVGYSRNGIMSLNDNMIAVIAGNPKNLVRFCDLLNTSHSATQEP